MAFRLVYTEFWNDPKVMEELTPEDKYFYLYLLTNPYTNMIGIYRIIKKQMAFDLGYTIESVNSLMDRFIKHHNLILYNQETKEICIKNYGRYNLNTKGGKPIMDCLKKDLSQVKCKSFIEILYQHTDKEIMKQLINGYREIQSKNKEMAKTGTCDDTYDDTLTTGGQIQNQILIQNQYPNPYPKPNPQPITSSCNDDFNIFKYLELRGFIGLSPLVIEQIQSDMEMYSTEEVKKAIDISDNNGVHNYTYVKSVLENRRNKGEKNGFTKQHSKGQGEHHESYGQGLEEGIGFNIDDM